MPEETAALHVHIVRMDDAAAQPRELEATPSVSRVRGELGRASHERLPSPPRGTPRSSQPSPSRTDVDDEACQLARSTSPTVERARLALGILPTHLLPRSRHSFEETVLPSGSVERVPPQIVEMRAAHHEARRQELAETLKLEVEKLRRQAMRAESQPSGSPGLGAAASPGGPASAADELDEADAKLAAEKRRLEKLAHRRQDEVARIIKIDAAMRESTRVHEEARERERLRAIEEARERERLQRRRRELKRKKEEENHARELAAEAALQLKTRQGLVLTADSPAVNLSWLLDSTPSCAVSPTKAAARALSSRPSSSSGPVVGVDAEESRDLDGISGAVPRVLRVRGGPVRSRGTCALDSASAADLGRARCRGRTRSQKCPRDAGLPQQLRYCT